MTSLTSPSPLSSFSHSSSTSSSSCYPSTSPRLSSKISCATSPRRWGQLTSPSPTQVMSPRTTSSRRLLCRVPHRVHDRATVPRATVPRGLDYDDAAIGDMLFNASENKSITLSEKACLLVSRRRPCPIDRGLCPCVFWSSFDLQMVPAFSCKDNTSKDPFSRCEICKNLGYRLS